MPEYIVNVREIHIQPHLVTANNPAQAIELCQQLRESGEANYDLYGLEYSHTLNSEFWTIDEIGERKIA